MVMFVVMVMQVKMIIIFTKSFKGKQLSGSHARENQRYCTVWLSSEVDLSVFNVKIIKWNIYQKAGITSWTNMFAHKSLDQQSLNHDEKGFNISGNFLITEKKDRIWYITWTWVTPFCCVLLSQLNRIVFENTEAYR